MDFRDKQKQRILYSHVRIGEEGCNLLDYLTLHFSRFDRNGWREQILCQKVTVNDTILPPDACLKRHDRVCFYPGELPEPDAELHFRTLWEDPDFLVLEKPPNLCVHPTGPFYRHTLWNLVAEQYGEIRFVSRLDRETSGLLLAARNRRTAVRLEENRREIRKEYLALVHGTFRGNLRATGFLQPDPMSRIPRKRRLAPEGPGEFSDTELFEEQRVPPDMTLVRAILHTGRQHQIRATLYTLGFPLVGDKLYGRNEMLYEKIAAQSFTEEDKRLLRVDHQCLHSAVLEFPHPRTGKRIRCESPFILPEFGRELAQQVITLDQAPDGKILFFTRK